MSAMIDKLNRVLEWLIICFLTVMLFSVLWGVCSRYILADQSSWTDELARFMLIWVSVLGAVYVSGKNAHIAIDLLPESISLKNKMRLDIFVSSVIFLFVGCIFIIGGGRYTYVSFKLQQTSAALGIPVGFIYLILPMAGSLILWYKTLQIKECMQMIKQNN